MLSLGRRGSPPHRRLPLLVLASADARKAFVRIMSMSVGSGMGVVCMFVPCIVCDGEERRRRMNE